MLTGSSLEARFTSNAVLKDQNPCSLMSPSCESALLSLIADGVSTPSGRKSFRDAANLTNSADDSQDTQTCNILAEALNKRVYPGLEDIGECQGVFNISTAESEDYSWETWEVKGAPLTGLSSIPPPSSPSNDTCHPTLPQVNDMYRIWTTATQNSRTDGGLETELEGVVPIISVFWEKNENGTVGAKDEVAAAARWSCVAPVISNKADEGTTEDGTEGAAARLGGAGTLMNVFGAVVAGTVAALVLS